MENKSTVKITSLISDYFILESEGMEDRKASFQTMPLIWKHWSIFLILKRWVEAIETEIIFSKFLGPFWFWRATKLISDLKGKTSEE